MKKLEQYSNAFCDYERVGNKVIVNCQLGYVSPSALQRHLTDIRDTDFADVEQINAIVWSDKMDGEWCGQRRYYVITRSNISEQWTSKNEMLYGVRYRCLVTQPDGTQTYVPYMSSDGPNLELETEIKNREWVKTPNGSWVQVINKINKEL